MASEEELFANIDALLAEEPQLPPPAERTRLREAAGITQARLAAALKTSTQTVKNYENCRSEPKSPRLEAYPRLPNGWVAKYPKDGTTTPPSRPHRLLRRSRCRRRSPPRSHPRRRRQRHRRRPPPRPRLSAPPARQRRRDARP
ncbi:helix-turn-helix transcriptional regulator [Streptomyces sp. NPDC058409]|uniref:helix-turn-helix transcriptional regulator n=1 Tax=Streptomyces sp. NPDC058409 TaxID=3346484 RepID=UPI003657A5FB